MTAQKEQSITTLTEPTATVEKLTDDAIKKRLASIARQHKTQVGYRDEAQTQIDALMKEKEMLIGVQIDRLKAQLPRDPTAKATLGEAIREELNRG